MLDTVLEIGQIEGDSLALLIDHCGLDVSKETSGFLLHPFSDGDHGIAEPCLGVGVPAGDGSLEPLGTTVGKIQRGGVTLLMLVVVFVTHFIIS